MKNLMKINSFVYLIDFINEHKKRLRLIKQIDKKYPDKKIIFQLCILGIESLAKYYKPQADAREKHLLKERKKERQNKQRKNSEWKSESEDGWRFILLTSKIMKKTEAEEFYKLFRCSYVHVGFPNPLLDFEDYDNCNLAKMSWKDTNKAGFNFDCSKEDVIFLYKNLICWIEDYFKKKGIKYRIFKEVDIINNKNWLKDYFREFKKRRGKEDFLKMRKNIEITKEGFIRYKRH
jgi:hypothetical protein